MPLKVKILLLALLPLCGLAQTVNTVVDSLSIKDGMSSEKALYPNMLYLGNIQYGSSNPTSISRQPWNVAAFDVVFSLDQGDFHQINEPAKRRIWDGKIYGIKKLEKIAFEGNLEYSNQELSDKQWKSIIFTSDDNPFFIGDSILGDYSVELFHLNGGFSYMITPSWHAGLRADYRVGSLADQSDPRPATSGMRFSLNPGIDYSTGNFIFGIAADLGWLAEGTQFRKVGVDMYTDNIFLFHGLAKPVNRLVTGIISYQRNYTGSRYGGIVDMVWDNKHRLANYLEGRIILSSEEAKDGGSSYTFRGGDYAATEVLVKDRFQIRSERIVHNISVEGGIKNIEGTWYTQTGSSDPDGTIIWVVRDKSVAYKEQKIQGSLSYRMDLMKNGISHLTWSVLGGYLSSDIDQYPELYTQSYTSVWGKADISKRFRIKRSLLGLSVNGIYKVSPDKKLNMSGEGTKFKETYFTPALEALAADYYSFGGGISYQIPVRLSNIPIWIGVFANGALCNYIGDSDLYKDTGRNFVWAGLNLVF